jgi:hypothetical protein
MTDRSEDLRRRFFSYLYRIVIPAATAADFVPPIKIVIADKDGRVIHIQEFGIDGYRDLLKSLSPKREANALRRQRKIFFRRPGVMSDRFPIIVSLEDRNGETWSCHFDDSGTLIED